MDQQRKECHRIIKNERIAKKIARSASRLHCKGFKAVNTDCGWIIGMKNKGRV